MCVRTTLAAMLVALAGCPEQGPRNRCIDRFNGKRCVTTNPSGGEETGRFSGSVGGGDPGSVSTDYSATTETDCSREGGFYTGPVVLEVASVTCPTVDEVALEVVTAGWTSDGTVYMVETGAPTPWDEEHDVRSVEFDPCGSFDVLAGALKPGDTSAFTCEQHAGNTLSYAARVYDIDGNFADCVAWGHDPQAIVDGSILEDCINCPAQREQLQMCVLANMAR